MVTASIVASIVGAIPSSLIKEYGGNQFGTDFAFTARTTGPSETFTIPCADAGVFNAVIDWGDDTPTSTITTYDDLDLAHTYATADDYQIRISGSFPNIRFNNGGDRLKVISVEQLGDVGWSVFTNAFYGCENMESFTAGPCDTSGVGSFASAFRSWLNITATPNMTGLDTSSATLMGSMMRDWNNVVSPPNLTGWDTSNVSDMSGMMRGWSSMTSPPNLSTFDTSSATSMSTMMLGWGSMTTAPDLSNFDTSNVTTMTFMMDGWLNMTTTPDLSGFVTSLVTSMSFMMRGWNSMTAAPDLSNFNTANVTTMASMMLGWFDMTTTPDLSSFNTAKVESMSTMMDNWNSMTSPPDLTSFNTSLVTTMNTMMRGWNSMTSAPDLSGFDTGNVTDMGAMVSGWSSVTIDSAVGIQSFDITALTSAAAMMSSSGMDTTAYDALLVAWEAQVQQPNVVAHFGSSTYTDPSAAATARAALITDGWTITDGGSV